MAAGYSRGELRALDLGRPLVESPLKTADQVVVVADSTKFGRTSLARLSGLGEIDILVTDDQISEQWKRTLTNAGVRLLIARPAADGNTERGG